MKSAAVLEFEREILQTPSHFLSQSSEERAEAEPNEWFGRFRLWYDQHRPFQDGEYLTLRKNQEDQVRHHLDTLPQENWPFYLAEPSRIDNHTNGFVLNLEQLSDVCYFDMRNLHLALDGLAPFVRDASFFIYSTGDAVDSWIEEYTFENGKLQVERFTLPFGELFYRHLDLYLALTVERDEDFLRFFKRHLAELKHAYAREVEVRLHKMLAQKR